MQNKGHNKDIDSMHERSNGADLDDFVLEKSIFSNIFEKDIRRVYIYKKAERLAKAIHLVAPAFAGSSALRDRVERVAVGLVDAGTLPPPSSRDVLSRELLALSSVLAIARTSGLLSSMNAELISKEAHALLSEIAAYEEPRIALPSAPTLAELFRSSESSERAVRQMLPAAPSSRPYVKDNKGHIKDTSRFVPGRREAILAVLRSKGPSYIKDISTVVRDVSEKTIQRELGALVEEGLVARSGERRWTMYRLSA